MGECGYGILKTCVCVFPTPVGDGYYLQGKTAGVPPEVAEGVDLLHIAGQVQMLHSRFYPSVGFFLDLSLSQVAELGAGVVGKLPL